MFCKELTTKKKTILSVSVIIVKWKLKIKKHTFKYLPNHSDNANRKQVKIKGKSYF